MIDGRLIRIGTAGWAIPRGVATAFPSEGSALARYATRLRGVEINSTFYRSHRPGTYARWAATTPPDFSFAVKLPRALTHLAKLADCQPALAVFLNELRPLGKKLGPLLVQLPPSLAYDAAIAQRFFGALREMGPEHLVACEPRHPSWFEREPDDLLAGLRVARVAADPGRHPLALMPGGWLGLEYHRLHGSPRMYYSAYGRSYLAALADRLSETAAGFAWCMFDNTTSGAAAANALELAALLSRSSRN
jgi:uncharacterized protein YecE (DUF72 family)